MLELFTEIYKSEPRADKSEINRLKIWLKNNGFPICDLPEDYIELLKESNGGDFSNGEREYQMLSIEEIMEYYEIYSFSEFMPYALPFAMDGCGDFYLFNLRGEDNSVYKVPANNLDWEEYNSFSVAPSFKDCIINGCTIIF